MKPVTYFKVACLSLITIVCCVSLSTAATSQPTAGSLWSHDNLFAWCVTGFDAKADRTPEQRAEMFQALGIKGYAYSWHVQDIPIFDQEIDAMQGHGINMFAWWFPYDADDPMAKLVLEVLKRRNLHPQLWVMQHFSKENLAEWDMYPKDALSPDDQQHLKDKEKGPPHDDWWKQDVLPLYEDFPKTPAERKERVQREAARIEAIVKLAAPYGVTVELYSHNGWYGVPTNEIAIIKALAKRGITNVGIVYNFSHLRDELHDDTRDFGHLWEQMKPYVVAINVTGTRADGQGRIYPSQGDQELHLMRVIEHSGWRGPVGVIAERGGDAAETLRNYITGVDWLAAEIKRPGSGGPRPFPPAR